MSLSLRRLAGAAVPMLALALLNAPGVRAQENPCAAKANPCAMKEAANPCAAKEMGKMGKMSVEDETKAIIDNASAALKLTDEQKTALAPIINAHFVEVTDILTAYEATDMGDAATEETAEALAVASAATEEEMSEVLTEEQMYQVQQLIKQRNDRVLKAAKKMAGSQSGTGY